ncbi:MAG TPA: MFS transporter [Sphingobium sp.]|nr:MFS transporter [Sphingobium sp.]
MTALQQHDRRQEIIVTAVLGLTFGIVFFDRNALNFLMPFVLRDVPMSNAQIGLLASGLAISWALSGFLAGLASDRLGRRKPLLMCAVIVFSLSSFVTGLSSTFLTLFGARLLMGFAEGPVLPLSQSLMAHASSPERRGLNMGLLQTVLSNFMGSLAAPLILVALANAYGWRPTFFVTAVPGLVAALLIWRFVDEPVSIVRTSHPQSGAGLREVFKARNIRLCLGISTLMVGWLIVGWVFLPIYFTLSLDLSPTRMSIIMSILGISGALGGIVIPFLSDRWGRRPLMIAGCLLATMTPLTALYGEASSVLFTLSVAIGWMAGGSFSLFMATIPSESAPSNHFAAAMALIMGVGEVTGGAAAPAVVGWLTDRFGPTVPLTAMTLFALLAMALSFALVETAPRQRGSASSRAPAEAGSELRFP